MCRRWVRGKILGGCFASPGLLTMNQGLPLGPYNKDFTGRQESPQFECGRTTEACPRAMAILIEEGSQLPPQSDWSRRGGRFLQWPTDVARLSRRRGGAVPEAYSCRRCGENLPGAKGCCWRDLPWTWQLLHRLCRRPYAAIARASVAAVAGEGQPEFAREGPVPHSPVAARPREHWASQPRIRD